MIAGEQLTGFDGRWLISDGLVITAIAVSQASSYPNTSSAALSEDHGHARPCRACRAVAGATAGPTASPTGTTSPYDDGERCTVLPLARRLFAGQAQAVPALPSRRASGGLVLSWG